MISRTTKRFREAFSELPKEIQRQARESFKLFQQNPQHPGLRFKKISSSDPVYSARPNVDYRALGVVGENEIIWFWIGAHAEYDKLIARM